MTERIVVRLGLDVVQTKSVCNEGKVKRRQKGQRRWREEVENSFMMERSLIREISFALRVG